MKHTPEPHEIIFVDNASTDGTVKWLKQLVNNNARYRLIENEKNLGFSKGCNQGIDGSSGEYIVLLNNDVVVTENWLSGMLDCLQSAPDIGIVGPMTNSISGPQKVGHVEYSSIEQLDAYARGFRERNRHRKIPLRRIVGFCMLFRRSLVDKIGLLDESFGSGNFEDDDFCLRATLLDFRNAVAGDVFIHHYGSRSFVGNAMDVSSSLSGNRKIFAEKWSGIDQQSPLGKKLIVVTALDRAWDFHHRGQADEAATTLLEGIKHAPDERSLYYLLAELLMDSKLFKDAIDVLNQLPQDNSDVRKITLMGYCKEGLELYEEAGTYAKQALSLNGCSAAALNLSGMLEFKQGARTRAESFFHKAIEADPGYGEPYTNLGVLKWAAEQHEDALSLLERGFTLSPLVMDIVTTYHTAVTASRSFARAESAFRAAKVFYPLNKRIAFLLIDVLLQQEQFDQAMNEVEQAISTFGIDDGILSAALNIRSKIMPRHVDKPSRTRHTLSLCMIVKNEERHLPKCLMSVKALVDEMVIIDTGSSDRTRDIATAFGAQVYDFPWTGDFDKARNFSLSKAAGDWILILDADEVLSPNDHPALLRLIAKQGKTPASYSFVSRNYILPTYTAGWTANDGRYAREEAGTGWIPSSKVRLFPRDSRIRFENPVHELVEPSLRINRIPIKICDIPVHHYGKLDPQKYTFKGEEYYLLGRKKLEEMGESADALRELAIQAAELGKYDESIELWQRALNLQPDMVLAYVSMASAYLELGNYSDALASSMKSFALAPNMKEAVYNYALCELYAGNVARTIDVLEELEKKLPDYPSAKILLVLAYCCERNKAKGVDLFWKLQKMNINFAESVHKLGRKLVAAGRIDYAVALLDMAIETNNVNNDILSLREACRTTTVNH
jgi:GT2 family glycosyltransferase/Flp pilus assembly protein TadD